MLQVVVEGESYVSPAGVLFHVLYLGQHGHNGAPVVVYTNLEPITDQLPAGRIWVKEEPLFRSTFSLNGDKPRPEFTADDYPLIRAILTAQYEKPHHLMAGTMNWAAHIAGKIKTFWKKDASNVE